MHITRRQGVYYFRKKIPVDLVAVYGKREIIYSLRTKERPLAARLALRAAVQLEDEFSLRRGEPLPAAQVAATSDQAASLGALAAAERPEPKANKVTLGCLIPIWRRENNPTDKTADAAPTSMRKQGRLIEHAQRAGFPLVLLCDADGGRIPDVMGWRFSVLPLDFKTFIKPAEGQPPVPRAAAILGPSYGDSALHASTAHFVVMVKFGTVALSGPSVVSAAIAQEVSDQELGGPEAAMSVGNAHMAVDTEAQAMEAIAAFLSYLPSNAAMPAPVAPARAPAVDPEELARIVPLGSKTGYDMHRVLEAIADEASILPWGNDWGPSLLTVLARIEGHPVGIVANQPMVGAGALDPHALRKEHDFVDMCDTFGIPLVFLHDVPGLLIGTEAERGGILRAYERLVSRIADARVPKVGVVIRKAYGGGHFAMGGRPTHPNFMFAWPSAEMGFMAPEAGVQTVYRRRLDALEAEEGPAARERLASELIEEWTTESEPWEAAAHLSLDDVIEPAQTRAVIVESIDIAWGEAGPRPVRSWTA